MKKRLYILRHATAEAASDDEGDHARPLSPEGVAEATRLGRWFAAQAVNPAQVLCSTAERTRQTHAALGLDAPLAYSDRLYLASASEMIALLPNITADSLLLIAHNAGAHELAAMLSGDGAESDFDRLRTGFPPCALAILGFTGDWSTLKPGLCHLEALLYPQDL